MTDENLTPLEVEIEALYDQYWSLVDAQQQESAPASQLIADLEAEHKAKLTPATEELRAINDRYAPLITDIKAKLADGMRQRIAAGGEKTLKLADGYVQLAAGRERLVVHPDIEDVHAQLFTDWWSNPVKYALLALHMSVTFDLEALAVYGDALPGMVCGYFRKERGEPVLKVK